MSKKKISFKPAADLRKIEIEKKEKIEAVLDKWVNNNADIKKGKKSFTRLNVNIPSDLHKRIKTHCAQKGIKVTDMILSLIKKELPDN